ncbi:hypothetical protein AVEN_146143-1 [Araneus ventricosus]|uniref:Uncharacterized protein n=1 Tax=Araneus ventricosus TaxID=182803 RepID=A0A4Y2EGI7_ARAVE|nr:hypothetical protein AVEN_146143-1 [Araneus ventricosus]
MNDVLFLPPQTDAKNNIKPRLPSDSSYSKRIFHNITRYYSDRRQRDNLASKVLMTDRQYSRLKIANPCLLLFLLVREGLIPCSHFSIYDPSVQMDIKRSWIFKLSATPILFGFSH